MKCQNLFSLKNKNKMKMSSAAVVIDAFRVKSKRPYLKSTRQFSLLPDANEKIGFSPEEIGSKHNS